jgi:hypothetical protein
MQFLAGRYSRIFSQKNLCFKIQILYAIFKTFYATFKILKAIIWIHYIHTCNLQEFLRGQQCETIFSLLSEHDTGTWYTGTQERTWYLLYHQYFFFLKTHPSSHHEHMESISPKARGVDASVASFQRSHVG